jgi:hypothetical protein
MENAKLLTEAQIEALNKAAEIVQGLFERLWEIIKKVAECIAKVWRNVIENYQNKRVVHLALHHKDLKVRRKNMSRIMRWLRRHIKCKE